MPDLIFRGDAVTVPQVTVATPTVANNSTYDFLINGKLPNDASFLSSGAATAQEIVEGLQLLLDALTSPPEFTEVTWTEDNATIIATGPDTGKPFTLAEGPGNGNWASITTGTAAKSPNHWIAENFTGGAPANSDSVFIHGTDKSLKWNLDQSTVTLTLLDVRADFTGEIGLPEINADNQESYYEYRDTHLKISATTLRIGDGVGRGSGRLKFNVGSNACELTVYSTGQPADPDEGAVHWIGTNAGNTIHVLNGTVDIAMLPGTVATAATIIATGGTVRCGTGCTLTIVEAAGSSLIETRSAVTTLRTRDNGRAFHQGSGNITTADIAGGVLKIRATGALTIGMLNGYGGKELDLTECDSAVTITDMNIYGTPGNPFTIRDPGNTLVMTNAANCPNGVQGLVILSGSERNLRVT